MILRRGSFGFAVQASFLRWPIFSYSKAFISVTFSPLSVHGTQKLTSSLNSHRLLATARESHVKGKSTSADLSSSAQKALASFNSQLRTSRQSPPSNKSRPRQSMSKKELKNFEGSIRRYQLMGDRPEFHNIDRNKNNHIVEPTDKFQIVLTTSKNNVHIQVNNRSRDYRTIFSSCAGNVGIYKAAQQTPHAAERIALNIARKCKRLGISHVDVKFRRIMRVDTCLQAFTQAGLTVTSLTHEPLLPKCGQNSAKPRKRRRV